LAIADARSVPRAHSGSVAAVSQFQTRANIAPSTAPAQKVTATRDKAVKALYGGIIR